VEHIMTDDQFRTLVRYLRVVIALLGVIAVVMVAESLWAYVIQ
jgi:hypothetical protein